MNDLTTAGSKIAQVDDVVADVRRVSMAVQDASQRGAAARKAALQDGKSLLATSAVKRRIIEDARRPASEEHIAVYLAQLLKAYPNVGKDDASAFGRLLLEDVIGQRPSVGAMEAGCRSIRQTSKFLPSIAEVLSAVREAEAALKGTVARLDMLPELLAELDR